MNWLLGKIGPDSGKIEPELSKTELGSGKAEPESGKHNRNRVVKSSYRKKQNRLWVKGSRRSWLRRRMKWRRMGHL
jgi:hypothetical protein